ncbi:uncharacterized protein GLRG_02123 [Colletotrichum graminicola M1.001]|uniref:Uncharacterized protein n=1 Tax=Colletotrichum graminicola (strain M1.001 / M2 / FGSC 10212) TaxID=645133 RepID=E3Q7U0_COLGM|nr:uncharacterized protein GLRG_02123 [Colletotrichum graminicola M1.001]EFQ26952.1 hypothetical protein GLRG_02123 [Colletotrichum graminicola M1.001]
MPFVARQQATSGHPGKTAINILPISWAAWDYGVSHMAVQKHLQALQEGRNLRASPNEPGRPQLLTEAEDTALGAFVIW